MPRTNISFTGNHTIDTFSFLGVNLQLENDNTSIIEKIKNNIINMFLLPLCSDQIEIVDKNFAIIGLYLKLLNISLSLFVISEIIFKLSSA